jgi:hypothetical protein
MYGPKWLKKANYGKILVVAFLTVLAWVWADLAKTEKLSVPSVNISIARSANPNLLVSFGEGRSSVVVRKLVLKGPTSKIDEVKRRLNDGSLVPEFFLDPQAEGMTTARQYTLLLEDFFRKSDRIKQLGLTVESCQQDRLTVNVVKLLEKSLEVRCVDEAGNPVEVAAVEPARLDMFVPADWEGERLVAWAQLGRREIEQARIEAVEKRPYVQLPGGRRKEATKLVKITTKQYRLNDYTITAAAPGFSLSANLQGKYKVEVTNPDAVMSPITIRATPEAKRAYEKMRYQVILEIDDSDKDAQSAEPLRRELIYNFPAEYVRRDEIVLNQQPVTARFKLMPLPSERTSSPQ